MIYFHHISSRNTLVADHAPMIYNFVTVMWSTIGLHWLNTGASTLDSYQIFMDANLAVSDMMLGTALIFAKFVLQLQEKICFMSIFRKMRV